jgi:hypothetical protein
MHHTSPEMKQCIENCLRCYSICLPAAMNHCLELGGKHVERRISAHDGMRGDLQDFGAFHADRHRASPAHLC